MDGLPGPRHMHRVGEVGPADTRVIDLSLQNLVGVITDRARDVIVLHQGREGGWKEIALSVVRG